MAKTLSGDSGQAAGAGGQDAAQMATDTPAQGGALSSEGLAQARAVKGPPPVHLWNPPFCGDIDIVIKRDGTWFHEGTPIGRQGLVNLFASILKREGEAYFLVTPVEKVGITVEDVPFIALDVDMTEGAFHFTTNTGDRVTLGPDHPLKMVAGPQGEDVPYVHIRRDLWARIDRKTFYRLADAAQEVAGVMGLVTPAAFYPLESRVMPK